MYVLTFEICQTVSFSIFFVTE